MDQAAQSSTTRKETPRYRLKATCYVNEKLYQVRPETEEKDLPVIEFDGVPGSYMDPINAAARAQVEKHKPKAPDINKVKL